VRYVRAPRVETHEDRAELFALSGAGEIAHANDAAKDRRINDRKRVSIGTDDVQRVTLEQRAA
jgi:hypothetical protein